MRRIQELMQKGLKELQVLKVSFSSDSVRLAEMADEKCGNIMVYEKNDFGNIPKATDSLRKYITVCVG